MINVTQETRSVIVVELSQNQAQMLYDLLGYVAGPLVGPRGFFSGLHSALRSSGILVDYDRRSTLKMEPRITTVSPGPAWVSND